MKALKQKPSDVEYVEGEDLNIENMKERIITKAWYDTARFNDITDVAVGVGMGTRTLYFYVKKLKLPRRSGLK
jgi:DNA-binding phage protein